ncbi:MAG: V-type ATP synthase subunit F [Candidatus Caldarchaeales archaeon]
MKVIAIGSKPFVSGFKLSGVTGIEVSSPGELFQELERFINREDIALIILDEDLSKHVKDRVNKIRIERAVPLIYELSGIRTEKEKIDYRSTLRKILGV